MTATLFNSWGREIASQRVQSSFDALSLAGLYSNWAYIIIVASNGRPCEMFAR
jgi:hypothetical protein